MTDTYKPKPDAAHSIAAPDKNLDTTENPATAGSVPCPECSGTGVQPIVGGRQMQCRFCDTGRIPNSDVPISPALLEGLRPEGDNPGCRHQDDPCAANPAPSSLPAAEDEKPAKPLRYFTTGDALSDFGPVFLNEDACREWAISRLHPGIAFCPGCGLKLDNDKSFRAGKRCHCGRCGRWFTATTGTFLDGMHLSFGQVFLLAALIEHIDHPARIALLVDISVDTVRLWMKKFRMLSHD